MLKLEVCEYCGRPLASYFTVPKEQTICYWPEGRGCLQAQISTLHVTNARLHEVAEAARRCVDLRISTLRVSDGSEAYMPELVVNALVDALNRAGK